MSSLQKDYTVEVAVHHPQGRMHIKCETWEGGNVDSEETKHRDVVTRQQTARGGQRTRDNVTVTRECDAQAWSLRTRLKESVGIDRVVAIRQMIDARGTAVGKPHQVTGILKAVNYPNFDLNGTDVGMLSLEISTDE